MGRDLRRVAAPAALALVFACGGGQSIVPDGAVDSGEDSNGVGNERPLDATDVDDRRPNSDSVTDPIPDAGPRAFEAFEFWEAWGPCPPEAKGCARKLKVSAAGSAELVADGSGPRMADLTPEDFDKFSTDMMSDLIYGAIADSTPCSMVVDHWETATLKAVGQDVVTKDIAGCSYKFSPPIVALEKWVNDIQAKYFK